MNRNEKIILTVLGSFAGGYVLGKAYKKIADQCNSPEAKSRLLVNRLNEAMKEGNEALCGELAKEFLEDIAINTSFGIIMNEKDLTVIKDFLQEAFHDNTVKYEVHARKLPIPYCYGHKIEIVFSCKNDTLEYKFLFNWNSDMKQADCLVELEIISK